MVQGLNHWAIRINKYPTSGQDHINRSPFVPVCPALDTTSPPSKLTSLPSTTPPYRHQLGSMLQVACVATEMALLSPRSLFVQDSDRSTKAAFTPS